MTSIRVLRTSALLAVLATLVVVCALAFLTNAAYAVAALAVALAAAGILRAVAPTSILPCARSRPFDVVFLLTLAAALAYLSTWADAAVPHA